MAIGLPVETLIAIFKEVDDVQDLCHLRMASRALCAITTPLAFSSLSVITTSSSAQNIGRLFDLPDIAAHVKEVSYHDKGANIECDASSPSISLRQYHDLSMPLHMRWRAISVRTDGIEELASLFSRIYQLFRLETINLRFNPVDGNESDSDSDGRLSLQSSILSALVASFNVRAPSKLTSLSLHILRASDPHPLETLSMQTILATLQRLKLSAVFASYPDPSTVFNRWHDFWGTLWLQMIPVQSQLILTELTLHSDVPVGTDSGLSLSELHLPCLSMLSLRNTVSSTTSPSAEDFILRHAATLMQLELLRCKVLVSDVRLLLSSESTNLATDVELRRRPYWDRIWDSFAAELTGIVMLHVDERHRDQKYRYVQRNFAGSYSVCGGGESRNVADLAALQRFRMAVATRSKETHIES